jgi:hypothetical protein
LKTKKEREGFGSGNRRRTSSLSQNLSQSNDDDVASIKKSSMYFVKVHSHVVASGNGIFGVGID